MGSNGVISQQEFSQSWNDLRGEYGLHNNLVEKFFRSMDTLNTGSISETEFVEHFVSQPKAMLQSLASLLKYNAKHLQDQYEEEEEEKEEEEEEEIISFENHFATEQDFKKKMRSHSQKLQNMEQRLRIERETSK